MSTGTWLADLARALRQENVDGWTVEQVLAEVRGHLEETGEDPERSFGAAEAYARTLSAELAGSGDVPSAGEPRLVVEGVGKRFGRRTVLEAVDLRVGAGEVAAVVGPNGAGKSTLLRICAGLLSPDTGAVTVTGTLGYCPQDPALVELLTPREHFVLAGAGRGLDRGAALGAGAAVARGLGWEPERRPVKELSGGTRQKLNLALAALGDPDLLLLDEPYQGFDRGAFLDFWEQVWHWRTAGAAVVVVTHRPENLKRVDTVLRLGVPANGLLEGTAR